MLQKIDECRKYKVAFSYLPANSYLTAFVFKAKRKRKCCNFCTSCFSHTGELLNYKYSATPDCSQFALLKSLT